MAIVTLKACVRVFFMAEPCRGHVFRISEINILYWFFRPGRGRGEKKTGDKD